MSTAWRSRAGLAVIVTALLLAFGPSLLGHANLSRDPHHFNDDVRQQIFPFFRDLPGGPRGADVLGDYQLDLMPIGFKWLYRGLEPLIDPEPLSKLLPYVLLVPLLIGIALAAHALGGSAAAIMSLALALQTPVFLERMMGGMPRAFAFPLIALGLWAAATARVRLLACLAVVGQAFYAVPTAVLGLALAGLLFVVPGHDRAGAARWTLTRRLLFLGIVGTAVIALTLPIVRRTRPYGRMLGPADVSRYEEMGEGGRYAQPDRVPARRLPPPSSLTALRQPIQQALSGAGDPIALDLRGTSRSGIVLNVLLAILMAGALPLAWQSAAGRRALVVPAAGIAGFVLAHLFSPYLYVPQRYALYALPVCAVVFLPACGGALAALAFPGSRRAAARRLGASLAAGVSLLLIGGRGDARAGFTMSVAPEPGLYAFVRNLPPDALVAGWPDGAVNNVPYVSRRRAFVTTENHMAFHEGYVLEMRRRVDALIRAFYGPEAGALEELRRDYGVTHLVVEPNDLRVRPRYFAPFTADIERAWAATRPEDFGVHAAIAQATVFNDHGTVVLDLSRLGR